VTDRAWIEAALTSARPQALGALARYFRDLDLAEEAFQDASLRALKAWPENGPPRDPTAWLIFVGRNAALDATRRRSKQTTLPPDEVLSDTDDASGGLAEQLDHTHYRDDVLRLMFICCHPELPPAHQIALALRIVSGLPVHRIARAFLVGDTAMEQRLTRAKQRIASARAEVPFEAPDAEERAARLTSVTAMLYLVFNEGYSTASAAEAERGQLCDEAIRLARLLLRLFPDDPEVMGLTALMVLQHARTAARFAEDGSIILLEDQDRTRWSRPMIAEGLALIDKAMRRRRPGAYQIQAAIAALHARAARAGDTDWAEIALLYGALEQLQPSPVITLNRAVAIAKLQGPEAALAMIEPLAQPLAGYFHFHGLRGGLLQQLGRNAEARTAFDQAIALAGTAAEAAHIRIHLDRLAEPVARKKVRAGVGPPVGYSSSRRRYHPPTRSTAMSDPASQPVVTGVTPYLSVRDASAASKFYQKAFAAEELARMPAEDGKRLMHCHLRINAGSLMLSDPFPEHGHPLEAAQGYVLHLQVDDADAWWQRAVDCGAEITMPIGVMFWGDKYGQLRDPFGVTWSIGGPNK
jgi:RNA polymerase sigma-70 factor (ECF subfamily)